MARINPLRACIGALIVMFCFAGSMPKAWCGKKSSNYVTTTNGSPIRKVFIRAASPEMTNSVATQLTQDTCLTTVSDARQADAVLEVGVALPGIDNSGPQTFGESGSSSPPQTMNGKNKQKPERSFSATCSNGKETGGCSSSSYTAPRGGVAQPPAEWAGNVGSQWDVSLTATADASQELWEPDGRSKKSWSEQLRTAAGCPVCPAGHFNRKQYASYRQWIEAKCPAVLAVP